MSDTRRTQANLLDQSLRAIELSSRAKARIREDVLDSATSPRTRVRRRLVWAGALATCVVLGGAATAWWNVHDDLVPTDRDSSVALPVNPDACAKTIADEGPTVLGSGCHMRTRRVSDIAMTVWEETSVTTRNDGVDLHRGWVMFDVDPVRHPEREHVRIGVPAGIVEVIGTRFSLRVSHGYGELVLYEGRVRFAHEGGAERTLTAGQSLEWTTAGIADAEPLAPPAPPDTKEGPSSGDGVAHDTRSTPEASQRDLAETLVQIEALRQRREYRRARRLLDRLVANTDDERTQEVLSFERGTLLEAEGSPDACKHWLDHARRFPTGRYRADVEQHLAANDCKET